MEPDEGPGKTGRHGLGPHVVGVRVVVRRLLRGRTGPTGGPAFTDVLGVCERWPEPDDADRTVQVRRADGELVRFPSTDVVSGKPVPPRPSIHRRLDARTTELHAHARWPALRTVPLGDWVLRLLPDGPDTDRPDTDRADTADTADAASRPEDPVVGPVVGPAVRQAVGPAHSCLAIGDPGVDIAEAARRVAGFYRDHHRTVLAQVERDTPIEHALRDLGWSAVADADTGFQVASVARVLRGLRAGGEEVEDGRVRTEVTSTERGARLRAAAGTVGGEAVVEGDWVGIGRLPVAAGADRPIGRLLLRALLEEAAALGALTAWLHVRVAEADLVAGWEALGFATHHTCRYLVGPGEAGTGEAGAEQRTPSTGA